MDNFISKLSDLYYNYGYLIIIFLASLFIYLIARKRTYRKFSFEIRSSLNNITGFTKLLLNQKIGPISEQQRMYLNNILESTSVIESVIQKIENERHHVAEKNISFALRSALMDINGNCQLLLIDENGLNQHQKECINDVLKGSEYIIKSIRE